MLRQVAKAAVVAVVVRAAAVAAAVTRTVGIVGLPDWRR